MINDLSPAEQQEFAALYTDCNEAEQQSAMANLQPVDVKMFRITINQEAEQQAAMANSGPAAPSPPFGPVVLPPSGSPVEPAPGGGEVTHVEQYHAQCTTANILSCVPECNATHHGFELLATIDGTDTKFSCNLANQLFSWVGAAALGGFLGRNVQAFVSAVISGAAGTYVLTLVEDADVGTDLVVQPGQHVIISGDAGLAEAPSWGRGGFLITEHGELLLTYVLLGTTHDIEIMVGRARDASSTLSLTNVGFSERCRVTVRFVGDGSTIRLWSMALPSLGWFLSLLDTMKYGPTGEYGGHHMAVGTNLELRDVVLQVTGTPVSGSIGSDGQGGAVWSIHPTEPATSAGRFNVISGPCTTSLDGRCVGRRYSELSEWPSFAGSPGFGIVERCEIVVLQPGVLGPSPFFDTVSYGPSDERTSFFRAFGARHDVVGLGSATCAPADCGTGASADDGGTPVSCYAISDKRTRQGAPGPDPRPPTGCHAGKSSPAPGTSLAAGETLTWAAAGTEHNAVYDDAGALNSNSESAHCGWELCFA
eukprot:SAG22_NODE_1326_length_4733_cov_7.209754_6_plen_537_part_00